MEHLTYTISSHAVSGYGGDKYTVWRVSRSDGMQLTKVWWACEHDADSPPFRGPFGFDGRDEAESFVRLSKAGVYLDMIPMPIEATGTASWEWAPAEASVAEG